MRLCGRRRALVNRRLRRMLMPAAHCTLLGQIGQQFFGHSVGSQRLAWAVALCDSPAVELSPAGTVFEQCWARPRRSDQRKGKLLPYISSTTDDNMIFNDSMHSTHEMIAVNRVNTQNAIVSIGNIT
jgi:hypothetical protein